MTVRMQPPGSGDVAITSYVAGRPYSCAPSGALDVPDFDAPGLAAQGWIRIGNVSTSATESANAAADVAGPSSAVDGHVAGFDGTTGKLIKDLGAPPQSVKAGAHTVTGAEETATTASIATGLTSPTTFLARVLRAGVDVTGDLVFSLSGDDLVVANGSTASILTNDVVHWFAAV